MSNPGVRVDDAPDFEETVDVEIEWGDGPGPDEGGADDLDGDPAGGDGDNLEEDHAAGDVQQAGQPAAQGVKARSPATIAVQEAKRAAKEAKAEAEAARREAAELRAAAQGRQTQQEQILEQERLALMPHDEKLQYLLNKQAEDTRRQVGALQFQMQDGGDRIAFQSLAARNDAVGKAYASIADEVEQRLAEVRRNGGNASRETVAKYILGERAVAGLSKAKPKQIQRGQENIQRQQARPTGGRGDVPGGQQRRGGDEAAARRTRLENQDI